MRLVPFISKFDLVFDLTNFFILSRDIAQNACVYTFELDTTYGHTDVWADIRNYISFNGSVSVHVGPIGEFFRRNSHFTVFHILITRNPKAETHLAHLEIVKHAPTICLLSKPLSTSSLTCSICLILK